MLMERSLSGLLIVDVQEKLLPAMSDPRRVVDHCAILMKSAARLSIPMVVSEQYPKGIGPTVPALRDLVPESLSECAVVEKMHFSCMAEPVVSEAVRGLNRPQIIVAGIEFHVCVLQTALDLRVAGYDVFVVADACASRKVENQALAASRLTQAGISLVSTEMVVFEWLHRAGGPEFKELSALIR